MAAVSAPNIASERPVDRASSRAARADRLKAEWKPLSALDATDIARWRELAGHALEPNAFLEPAFATAALGLPEARGVGAMMVRSGGRLLGFLPGRIEGLADGRPVSTFVAWTHPYAPLSTPLVDRERADDALEALAGGIARLPQRPRVALMPLFAEESAVARRVGDLLYRRGQTARRLDPHRRAALIPQPGSDPLAAVSTGRLKELRRQHRRLGESGALDHKTIADVATIRDAVAAYLALEATGWKGRAGSAAGLDDAARTFLSTAVIALAHENKARVELLTLGGTAIAAAIVLFSGTRAWFWKIAYDEGYARFSPGAQLALALTRSLGTDARLDLVDSCAVAGHPMIEPLWSGRLALADWLVALPGAGRFDLQAVYAAESLRRAAIKPLKRLRDRLHTL
jgi:CelD/BcsL family acetyltransferase involved in cellulose biosynthesis